MCGVECQDPAYLSPQHRAGDPTCQASSMPVPLWVSERAFMRPVFPRRIWAVLCYQDPGQGEAGTLVFPSPA